METIKENKGKEMVDEVTRSETQSQPRPFIRDKRKTLTKMLDLGNLPSRRGKKTKHGFSRLGVVKPSLPTFQLSIPILMLTRPFPLKSLQLRPLLPPRLNLPEMFL